MNEADYEIDLTIEAVTGTVYDLCVSPFETILGIKTKIQKLEGIPVSQQHLIHGNTELMDEFCLEEYHIRSGSQLKLVIAMRGGPIHAHRIQFEDFALFELAEYLETQSPDEQDQYAVMFLSDDNELRSQLHSPIEISESHLRGSQTSLLTTSKPTKVLSTFENDVTFGKMREIQSRLKSLRLDRTEHIPFLRPGQTEHHTDFVLHNSMSSRLPSSTPPSLCTCGCHKKHCQCLCHAVSSAQRRLHFTPLTKNENAQEERHSRITSSRDVKIFERYPSARLCHEKRRRSDLTYPKQQDSKQQGSKQQDPKQQDSRQQGSRQQDSRQQGSRQQGSKQQGSKQQGSKQQDSRQQGSRQQGSMKHLARLKSNETRGPNEETLPRDGHFLPPINNCKTKQKQPQVKREHDHLDYLPPIIPKQPSFERNKCINKCMKCHKRTRLANSFTCRCGGIYCSIHRYAETHSCTFNYKAEGKDIIARNNPLVTAPKLSKI